MCLLYTFRKCGIPTSNIGVLELATHEHVRQSGLTCQCGCVPYVPLQTDGKTLHQISQSVSEYLRNLYDYYVIMYWKQKHSLSILKWFKTPVKYFFVDWLRYPLKGRKFRSMHVYERWSKSSWTGALIFL